jgi:hypothetical protein
MRSARWLTYGRNVLIALLLLRLSISSAAVGAEIAATRPSERADGYRGIWFTLGQPSEHGDKYSGGLGTYTANHVPVAVYSAKAKKTFFVYGGTRTGERHLLICASYFDHATGKVPRPTIVHDKQGVNDPHDNAALAIDDDGYVWVFVSGRARARPGLIYRSVEPYSVDSFEKIAQREMTYPQPKFIPGEGFFYLFTKYTKGRELYWQRSRDGREWEPEQKLVGFGGHYQVSGQVSGRAGKTIGSAFMWHPGGRVDDRTNLYYVQTRDLGKSWTTVDGRAITTPLESEKNVALLIDYQAQGKNVYIHDLNFDADGRPAILYLTSKGAAPGPQNGPRQWRVTKWDGAAWQTYDVCQSDHNYDTGSLYIAGDRWTVVGPTEPGPQPIGTGGDIAVWCSDDAGRTWRKDRQLTHGSRFNHSYARRPLDAAEPFSVFWADGDPNHFGESRLYFGSLGTSKYWMLPYDMDGQFATPIEQHQ